MITLKNSASVVLLGAPKAAPAGATSSVALPTRIPVAEFLDKERRGVPALYIHQLAQPIPISALTGAAVIGDVLTILSPMFPNAPVLPRAGDIIGFVIQTQEMKENLKATHGRIDQSTLLEMSSWLLSLPSLVSILVPELKPIADTVKPIGVLLRCGTKMYSIVTSPGPVSPFDGLVIASELEGALPLSEADKA